MGRTVHVAAMILLVLACGPGLAQEQSSPAPKLRIDLTGLKPPSFDEPLAGELRYVSPLGGDERSLNLVKASDGPWLYEGFAGESKTRALLKLQRSPKAISYRGEAVLEFDPCLGTDPIQATAVAYPNHVNLEILVPYTHLGRPAECETPNYELRTFGDGGRLRLKPRSELIISSMGPDGAETKIEYKKNAPVLKEGTPVRVGSTLRDDAGVRWCFVTDASPSEDAEGDVPAGSGWVKVDRIVALVRYTLRR